MIRYRGRYAIGLACLLATGTLAMAVPYLLKRAVDTISAGGSAATVGWLAAGIIAVALMQSLVRTCSRFLIFNVGRDIEYDLRNDLFAHLERLPLSYYQTQQTGDLMSRLVNDITAVRMLLGVGFLNLINTPIYYLYAVTIMVSMDWRLTLASLVPYPLVLIIVKRTSRQLMERTLKTQEGLAAMSSRVQENLSGIHVVQAYVREEAEIAAFARLNADFSAQNMALAQGPRRDHAGDARGLDARDVGGPLVRRAARDRGRLEPRRSRRLHRLPPHPRLADDGARLDALDRAARARGAAAPGDDLPGRARDRRRARGTARRWPRVPLERPLTGAIAFRDMDFAYDAKASRRVLSDVDLTLPAGATLAVVGRTGSGKTSLVQLLPRLVRCDHRDGAKSTVATSAPSRSRPSGARSATCRRTRSSSRGASATTSASARPRRTPRRSSA